ncbi:putative membrane protein [Clostridioides difficile CD45]|nr:putative membrane protein [Clostridioides difficile CD45]
MKAGTILTVMYSIIHVTILLIPAFYLFSLFIENKLYLYFL